MNFPLNAKGGWIVPSGTTIPANTVVPAHSEFGNWCAFGGGCKFGGGCVVEGLVFKWLMTASNIDGSGRQVLIVSDGDTVLVRAGCFLGSVEQFTAKATADGKHVYAAVIPAMVAARQSIEGGK